MRRTALLLMTMLTCYGMQDAQAQPRMMMKPGPPLTEKAIEEVINGLVPLLDENYVFPDKAREMNALLKRNLAEKKYTGITDHIMLAQRITGDLRSISSDKHLRIVFAPPVAADLKSDEPGNMREGMDQRARLENHGIDKVERLGGNIGYININRFFRPNDEMNATVAGAMAFLANSDAIIVDLRQCGGGHPLGVQLFCSYFFGNEPVHLNSIYDRPHDETEEFWTLAEVQGRRMPDVPVYVLTSSKSFSGAEEFAYNLQQLKRATIVGEITGGGAHPVMGFYLTDEFVADIPTARAINPITGTNWEGVGVRPDVEVKGAEALVRAHELALGTLPASAPPEQRMQADWILMGSKAAREKRDIAPGKLKDYSGNYGNRKVTWQEGELIYERPEVGSRSIMEPMGGDLFGLKENKDFRIRFERDDKGNITALTGLYANGMSDVSPRVQ